MKNKLKKLSTELKQRGHIESSRSIDGLIKDLYIINNTKEAEEIEEETEKEIEEETEKELAISPEMIAAMRAFFAVGSSDPETARYEELIRCADDYWCGSYKLEKMEKIGHDLISGTVNKLVEAKNGLDSGLSSMNSGDKGLLNEIMTIDYDSHIDTAQEFAQEFLEGASLYADKAGSYIDSLFARHDNIGGLSKIAAEGNYLTHYSSFYNKNSKQLELEFMKYATATMADPAYMNKFLEGDKTKEALRVAGKRPGFWGKAFPFVGIIFSLPLAIKNTIEALNNGKAILFELPFEKYGINKLSALTPAGIPFLVGPISSALESNADNVENLNEILTIMKTVSSFWLDVIFAITNAIALILDIAAILFAFFDGPLPIADVLAGGISILLTAGLIGIEFGSEHYLNKFWSKEREKLKDIARKRTGAAADFSSFEGLGVEDDASTSLRPAIHNVVRLVT